MKLNEVFDKSAHYEMCLVWSTEELAAEVKEHARKRDGVDLVVDANVMYFPDKFTFDHIVYHYSVKSLKKPIKKKVADLQPEDFQKRA